MPFLPDVFSLVPLRGPVPRRKARLRRACACAAVVISYLPIVAWVPSDEENSAMDLLLHMALLAGIGVMMVRKGLEFYLGGH